MKPTINYGLTDLNTLAQTVSNNLGGGFLNKTPINFGSSDLSKYGINMDFSDKTKVGEMMGSPLPNSAVGDTGLFTKKAMFGEGGWVMPAAQVGAGLLQGFMGLKQLKLAKDMFRQQSEYAATDLANQAKTVNERLATRQARRVQENPNATPVNEFMSKYAVSGKAGG